MSDLPVNVSCASCSRTVHIPANWWYAYCQDCNELNVEPIENGHQYVFTECKSVNRYRQPANATEITCKCCKLTHILTYETAVLHGHSFRKAVVMKKTAEQQLEETKENLEKVTSEKEKMKMEMEKMRKETEEIMAHVVECDKCHKKQVLEGYVDVCECSATLLRKIKDGFKYVNSGCPVNKYYRLNAESTWFTCKCCHRERIIGSLLPEKICGQEVYSSELRESIAEKQEIQISDLTAELEKMKEVAEEGKRRLKTVEETHGLQIEELKKTNNLAIAEQETKIMELSAALDKEKNAVEEAKLTTKYVEEAFGRQINDLHVVISKMELESKCDKEKINKLKNRIQEGEEAYMEQKTELVNEVARFERDMAELNAECDSLADSYADVLAKMAETQAKCKELEQEKETMSNINNNLMAINMMMMKKINALAEASFGPDFKKHEKKIQYMVDMQTARM